MNSIFDKSLWSQFCRLGEMIGDDLHHEEPWILEEYNRLSEILLGDESSEKNRDTYG